MSAPPSPAARSKSRNLLGVLAFLRKYPGRVSVCFSLLMVIVGIDLSIPQFIGVSFNDLRRSVD